MFAAAGAASLLLGLHGRAALHVSPEQVLAALHGNAPGPIADIVLQAAVAARACGVCLRRTCWQLAGALLQVLLRNPLADPYVLGISGGAGLGLLAATAAGLGYAASQLGRAARRCLPR